MNLLIISNNSKKIGALELLVTSISESITIKHFDSFSADEAENFDLIILSGGSNLAIPKNREILQTEIELIKKTEKPIIGICLGFELIIEAFGGELLYRKEKVQGINEIKVLINHPIFKSKKKFLVHEAHKYYVEKVPQEFSVLADSKFGVEIIAHTERPVWGFQFHPENNNEENGGTELFYNLIEYLKNTSWLK